MKLFALLLFLVSYYNSYSQQGKGDWVFLRFSSDKLQNGSRYCTLYYNYDTLPRTLNMKVPCQCTYQVYYNGNSPLLFDQGECLFVGEAPFPVARIHTDKVICPGDTIVINMDDHKSIPHVVTPKR